MEKRIDKIRHKVETEGEVFVTELSELYDVTEETIRRDLEKLKNEGVVTRTFGGAVLNTVNHKDHIHFFKRKSINIEEKRKIASMAVKAMPEMRTLMADNSTTVMEAMKLLKNKNNITTITFSAQIFQELDGAEMRVISSGGRYDEDTLSFQGNLAIDSISKYYVDVVFLSCKGLSFESGLMDSTEGEAILKSEMAKRANTVVLLADHTKFNQTAFVNFLSIDKLDYLITDMKPDDKWVDYCNENDIKLIY